MTDTSLLSFLKCHWPQAWNQFSSVLIIRYIFRDSTIVYEPKIFLCVSSFKLSGWNIRDFSVPTFPKVLMLGGKVREKRAHSWHQIKHNYITIALGTHFKVLMERGWVFALGCLCSFLLPEGVPNYCSECKVGSAEGRLSN